jgi:small subunit ribosomal protein S3
MGQKTKPIANRLGIIRGWDSNWYGGRSYKAKLMEDDQIRKYLNARLAKAGISRILIERTLKLVTVTIDTARPVSYRERRSGSGQAEGRAQEADR